MAPATRVRVQLVKWGNSQAVRLPKSVLEIAHIQEGDELSVQVEPGRIALEPARPIMTLDALIERITPKNIHTKTDWGKARGKEIW